MDTGFSIHYPLSTRMFYGTAIPQGCTASFECVGAFVEYDGTILFLKRDPTIIYGGTWGMPAGKIEPGETRTEAMARELREEAGLSISLSDREHFCETVFVELPETGLFAFHIYRVLLPERPSIRLLPGENTDHRWMTPDEALALQHELFPDTDQCIARIFKR